VGRLAQLNPERDAATIIERTLRFGTRNELCWLFSIYSKPKIADWVQHWGKYGLPEEHLAFWVLFLGIEKSPTSHVANIPEGDV